MMNNTKITFNILASCVTRDSFKYLSDYDIDSFLQYGSVFSYAQNIELPSFVKGFTLNDVENGTTWQKKCLFLDVTKNTLNSLKKTDYIVIDMSDARFPLYNISDNDQPVYLTDENVLQTNLTSLRNNILIHSKPETIKPWELDDEYYNSCLDNYVASLKKMYKPSQIILVECYLVDCYFENNDIRRFANIDTITEQNAFLMKINRGIRKRIKGCHIIEMPDFVLADKKHRWGLYPLHYGEDYYKYVASCIRSIVDKKPNIINYIDNEKIKCTHKFSYKVKMIINEYIKIRDIMSKNIDQ